MINVLTVEREYGCGGGEIARKVADRLGWTLWDQRLTSEIARLSKCEPSKVKEREERVDPLYYRLVKSILRGSFEGNLNADRLQLLDADRVFRLSERLVQEAASGGSCVIVGRGSQHFLRDRNDTLRVFLYAPREDKLRRLIARGKSEKEANELVDTIDRDRVDFIQKYFNVEWPSRAVYHIMLNTSLGDRRVVDAILDLMKVVQ